MDINKLYCLYDEYNDCYCISNDKEDAICDADVAIFSDINIDEYLCFLITEGNGYFLDDEKQCVGFKTMEDAEKCLELLTQHEFKKEEINLDGKTGKINKKEWLKGLILMGINNTKSQPKDKQHEFSLNISKDIADIIIKQFNKIND